MCPPSIPSHHTIKLVEACLREHRRIGEAALLAPAAHRLQRALAA